MVAFLPRLKVVIAVLATHCVAQALTDNRFSQELTNTCSANRRTEKACRLPHSTAGEGQEPPPWNQDLPWPELDLHWCLPNWHDGKLVPYDG